MKPEHCEALRRGSSKRSRPGLTHGGSSIDDYRDARGERGSMQDEFLVHTREGEECLRGDGTIERIVVGGQLDLLLRRDARSGCARRPRRRKKTPTVSDPSRRPDGFLIGHWTDEVGAHRLHGRDRAGGVAGRGGRARRRAGDAGDRCRSGRLPGPRR